MECACLYSCLYAGEDLADSLPLQALSEAFVQHPELHITSTRRITIRTQLQRFSAQLLGVGVFLIQEVWFAVVLYLSCQGTPPGYNSAAVSRRAIVCVCAEL